MAWAPLVNLSINVLLVKFLRQLNPLAGKVREGAEADLLDIDISQRIFCKPHIWHVLV